MQRLGVSGAVRPVYGSLGVKRLRCLMTILDNYMFRPLLAIFRLSLRELKVLPYIMWAHMVERSIRPGCVIVNYYVQCGGVLCTVGSGG